MRRGLLAVGVGLALADSSIVTLALPEILGQFDVAITSVSWVLTSFNLVLAVVAVPAAYVSRRRPRESYAAGVLVFGTASLVCGLAPSFDVLVGARCVQAIGAAFLVTSALDLLSQRDGDERALRAWVVAGVFGAALGPAAGGVLTQLLGWESIFLAQVPLALLAAPGAPGCRGTLDRDAGRPSGGRGERGAPLRRGRARGRALPRRAAPRRRLGHVARRGRARRDGHAADRDRSRTHATAIDG